MTIVPNHACVVANLSNRYVVADGDQVLDQPIVDAPAWSTDDRR